MSEQEKPRTHSVVLENVTIMLELTNEQIRSLKILGKEPKSPGVRGPRTESIQHKVREFVKKYIHDRPVGFIVKSGFIVYEVQRELRANASAISNAMQSLVRDGYFTKLNKTNYSVTGKKND